MKRIFGANKSKTPAPTLEQTSDRMTTRADGMDEKIRKLDNQLMTYKEQIKRTRPGPALETLKRRALAVLKQKRMYEGQRDTLYQQQFNVEQTRFTVDSMTDTVQTVQAMKAASKEMKTAVKKNKELDLNYIDKLQDELSDMAELTNEINDMMARSYDVPDGLDEDDLMGELDALEADLSLEDGAKDGMPSYLQEQPTALPEVPAGAYGEHGGHEEELGLPALRS